jgi:hypothetical protein
MRKFASFLFAAMLAFMMCVVDAQTPTPSPTTHHNSRTGKFFGIACAVFLLCVAAFTYYYNMASINALLCCKKAEPQGANKPLTDTTNSH